MNMRIPYVIDNRSFRLADVLNHLLAAQPPAAMDIATAYFNIRGYEQIKHGLAGLRGLRLLLGVEPTEAADLGLRPFRQRIAHQLRRDLNDEPFDEDTLLLVEDLIRYLMRDSVEVPLIAQPNAGKGRLVDKRLVYDMPPADLAAGIRSCVEAGARFVGGCCGTSPAHIEAMVELVSTGKPSD